MGTGEMVRMTRPIPLVSSPDHANAPAEESATMYPAFQTETQKRQTWVPIRTTNHAGEDGRTKP